MLTKDEKVDLMFARLEFSEKKEKIEKLIQEQKNIFRYIKEKMGDYKAKKLDEKDLKKFYENIDRGEEIRDEVEKLDKEGMESFKEIERLTLKKNLEIKEIDK